MFYFVEPEDSLELIAWKFSVSMTHLFQYNPTTYYYPIHVGQRLSIPLPDSRILNTYTVTTGDTLESIAQKFNTTKQSIMQLNNLSSEVLVPGQKLKISSGSRIPSPDPSIPQNYVVQIGDTLDSIAQKFNVTKQSIMSFNHLSNDFIVPDQVLKIPTRSDRTYNNYRSLTTYTVQVGDTLDSIANKFHTTKKNIMQLNGLASEVLKAGQIIQVGSSREIFTETNVNSQNYIGTDINQRSKYKFMYLHDLSLDKNIDIWKDLGNENPFFFISKMAVTAAGAPTAFHQENQLAYDFLDNAGTPGNWWGLVTENDGFPMVQGINEPAPGYFISKTALSDCKKPFDDPTRYVDATIIPYITLPTHHMMGAMLGDFCVVINTKNNKIGYAIIADFGPDDSIGIGSVALAKDLGIESSPKIGGVEDGIFYLIFPQSGKNISKKCYEECYNKCTENCDDKCDNECYELNEQLWCKPKTREQIINEAQELFNYWGGIEKVDKLFGKFPLSHANIIQ